MQWGNIKTLFILCFLILDVYLLFQFLERQDQADLNLIGSQEQSIEDQLESENITMENINLNVSEESYISAAQREFSTEGQRELAGLEGQESVVISDNYIVSLLDEPISISEDATADEISSLVTPHILAPESYTYWDWNTEHNVLIFFQTNDDRPIYFNQSAVMLGFLNDQNELVFLSQTMLAEAESQEEQQPLIEPIRAAGILYTQNQLFSEDHISSMNLGYFTRVPLQDGVQVFAPTYNVVVNGERNYFVNAIEGVPSPSEANRFLQDSIDLAITNVQTLSNDQELKEPVLNLLEAKQQQPEENRSEIE
ncbi:two-component system regulatory protein YycI [Lentibacillus sediminis]|uniref:two-component system regulatory protein YycI n=1 Tax=Lentibacillus sediminis TaxID=1940529 RepID=UPI000C1C091B|nr:two-component system regulatory protein YycI [Lentibacillus sediminis]